MIDTSSHRTEADANRHVFAWLLFPLALFPLVALLTYDWCAIPALNVPAAPSTNWIGSLGDTFAYYGYTLIGLAIWVLPVLCVIAGLCMIAGRKMHPGRRELWFVIFLMALAGLVQVIGTHTPAVAALAARVNTANAGGAVGYLLMTRFMSPLVSDFGSAIIMVILIAGSLVAAIGAHNLAAFFRAVFRWATAGGFRREADGEDDPFARIGTPGEDGVPDESDPAEAAYLAALKAKEEARRQREEEKQRAKDEKQRAKEEKQRIKDEMRTAREAEKAAARASKYGLGEGPLPPPPVPAAAPAVRPAVHRDPPAAKPEDRGPYLLPPMSLLAPVPKSAADHSDVGEMSQRLIETLKLFNVEASLAYTVQGPVVTKYALTLAPGTRYSAVTNVSDNLMGALRAKSLRIEAPIPGEDCVGIEVPNRAPAGISFHEIFESKTWKDCALPVGDRPARFQLPLLFGKNAAGKDLVADLATMPHMLVAGATGQGKSVCLNSLICGLLMTRTPEQLKLIMVDPKMVEFTPYASIPHLIVPVITENRKVVFSLHWAVAEMEKRLKLFARARVRNIYDFNHRKSLTQTDMFGADSEVGSDMPKTVPYIVIIIDEAADLIGQCGKEVNPDIQRITQKARAAGIHLILATQRPDAKIITGSIKANIPGRVAFKTSSSVDSRTILDETGAENLIGKGDMLFRGKDNVLVRAQGAWISDDEIARVTAFIEQHSTTDFDERFAKKLGTIKEAELDPYAEDETEDDSESAREEAAAAKAQVRAEENASDFKKAVECIINTNRASTSHFQRKLGWGYNHSAKIMDMLEEAGIIGPQSGAGPRQIVMDQQQLLAIFNGECGDGADVPADDGADTLTEDSTNITEEQV